jgi:hypothetical protein
MPIPVSLQDVVDELGLAADQMTVLLNRRTGEFLGWNEDWGSPGDEDEDLSHYPEWQREVVIKYREACDSKDWLPLPSQFDIHEWDIMSRFCDTVGSERRYEDLRDAIRGRGAFRRFKDTATRLGLIEAWYKFRGDALREIAIEWLEENKIPYTVGSKSPATK